MKFAAAAAAAASALALFSSSAVAQYNHSAPFKLLLLSDSPKYNGSYLESVHEGAAIEGLAPVKVSSDAPSYSFKYYATEEGSKKYGPTGTLIYNLQVDGENGTETEHEEFTLFQDPSTNVALGLFEPTEGATQIGFDTSNNMNMQSYLIDTVTPPTETKDHAYYRWYICETNFEGYVYEVLNWVYGKYPPQNPSCVKVTVQRVFSS